MSAGHKNNLTRAIHNYFHNDGYDAMVNTVIRSNSVTELAGELRSLYAKTFNQYKLAWFHVDLYTNALNEVDWNGLAESYWEDYKKVSTVLDNGPSID